MMRSLFDVAEPMTGGARHPWAVVEWTDSDAGAYRVIATAPDRAAALRIAGETGGTAIYRALFTSRAE